MDDFRLKVFISVARNKSFTAASHELFISQPAISKHIRELEEKFKTRLFERMGSRIELTKAGELLLSHADRIINNYHSLEFEMNQLNGTFSGELKIGASTTISQYVLPSLLAKFISRYPDIKITLISGNTKEIEKALLDNVIDLGMVEGAHNNVDIKYLEFMDDEIVLIAKTNGVYDTIDEVSLEKLVSLPLVMREYGSGTLEVIENALAKKNLKLSDLNIMLNLGNTESIKSFIAEADCTAMVSVRSILKELKAGAVKIIDINKLEIERKFRFIVRYGAVPSLAEKFIEFTYRYNQKL